ncbi:hypothetical protein KY284_007824 [Solanum tuberosum]|nr:hypothetical protein KY284_007824 [Solanum tuberosum]
MERVVNLGLIDRTLLLSQYEHKSELLWKGEISFSSLMRTVRMNDTLNLFHLHRPHGRVEEILRRSGLYDVVCMGMMHYDCALVTTMVERWRPETHCFHLPFGEDAARRIRINGKFLDFTCLLYCGFIPPLQVWCWERILLVQPSALSPHDCDVLLPYARRWTREIDRNTESHHVLIPIRDQLYRMTKDQYVNIKDLPAKKRKRDNEDEDGYTELRPRDVLRISRKGCGT